jgi:DNA repair exonuclease SbcCD ATPase subunit
MYFALGLLTAGLLALLVTPAIWHRAMRLTRQRIERSVPMTLAEIEADKDQLRAEFAMSSRRMEMSTDRLREKTTEQVIEINKKRAEIVRLSNEVNDQAEAIETLEKKLAGLDADHATAVEDLRGARELIAQHEADLANRIATIEKLEGLLSAADQLTAEQKLELAANATHIANLTDRLDDTSAALASATAERDRLAASLVAGEAALAAERRRTANLEASVARIEAERANRLAELERRAAESRGTEQARGRFAAEGLAARIAELQATRQRGPSETPAAAIEDATVQARIAELQGEQERLRAELETRNAEIAALKTEVANLGTITEAPPLAPAEQPDGDNVAKAIAAAEAERAELVAKLNNIEAANQALAAENAELKRLTGPDWNVERENALLRDRLAQIAADVVRMSDGFSATPAPAAANGGNGHATEEQPRPVPLHPAPGAPEADETARPAETRPLAERLRALQHTAARH